MQHADNPVDWHPWGRRRWPSARNRRPIFLASATRRATGATSWSTRASRTRRRPKVMNEHFVCVKVDREERPDLDTIYMNALQVLTRQAAAGR